MLNPCVQSSPAGLTRGSIFFARTFFREKMDCRVKPGNHDAYRINTKLKARLHHPPAGLVDQVHVVEARGEPHARAFARTGSRGSRAPHTSIPLMRKNTSVSMPIGSVTSMRGVDGGELRARRWAWPRSNAPGAGPKVRPRAPRVRRGSARRALAAPAARSRRSAARASVAVGLLQPAGQEVHRRRADEAGDEPRLGA